MGEVVQLPQTRRRVTISSPAKRTALLYDFKTCGKSVKARRSQRAYLERYVESFYKIEAGCIRIMECFYEGVPFKNLRVENMVRNFLATGSCLLMSTKFADPESLECLERAQDLAEELRQGLFHLPALNDLNRELVGDLVWGIELLRHHLHVTLAPFLDEPKFLKPAHL